MKLPEIIKKAFGKLKRKPKRKIALKDVLVQDFMGLVHLDWRNYFSETCKYLSDDELKYVFKTSEQILENLVESSEDIGKPTTPEEIRSWKIMRGMNPYDWIKTYFLHAPEIIKTKKISIEKWSSKLLEWSKQPRYPFVQYIINSSTILSQDSVTFENWINTGIRLSKAHRKYPIDANALANYIKCSTNIIEQNKIKFEDWLNIALQFKNEEFSLCSAFLRYSNENPTEDKISLERIIYINKHLTETSSFHAEMFMKYCSKILFQDTITPEDWAGLSTSFDQESCKHYFEKSIEILKTDVNIHWWKDYAKKYYDISPNLFEGFTSVSPLVIKSSVNQKDFEDWVKFGLTLAEKDQYAGHDYLVASNYLLRSGSPKIKGIFSSWVKTGKRIYNTNLNAGLSYFKNCEDIINFGKWNEFTKIINNCEVEKDFDFLHYKFKMKNTRFDEFKTIEYILKNQKNMITKNIPTRALTEKLISFVESKAKINYPSDPKKNFAEDTSFRRGVYLFEKLCMEMYPFRFKHSKPKINLEKAVTFEDFFGSDSNEEEPHFLKMLDEGNANEEGPNPLVEEEKPRRKTELASFFKEFEDEESIEEKPDANTMSWAELMRGEKEPPIESNIKQELDELKNSFNSTEDEDVKFPLFIHSGVEEELKKQRKRTQDTGILKKTEEKPKKKKKKRTRLDSLLFRLKGCSSKGINFKTYVNDLLDGHFAYTPDEEKIESLKKPGEYEKFLPIIKKICGFPVQEEELHDFLMELYSYFTEPKTFNKIKLEKSKHVTENMVNNKSLLSCTFGPDGFAREACLSYTCDPNIDLLFFRTYFEDKFIENVGVAYIVKTEGNILLVDSVDGGAGLRNSRFDWKEMLYNTLINPAFQIGITQNPPKTMKEHFKSLKDPQHVFLNVNTSKNRTPNEFLKYVCDRQGIEYTIKDNKIIVKKPHKTKLNKPLLADSNPEAFEAIGTNKTYLDSWYKSSENNVWNRGRGSVDVIIINDRQDSELEKEYKEKIKTQEK